MVFKICTYESYKLFYSEKLILGTTPYAKCTEYKKVAKVPALYSPIEFCLLIHSLPKQLLHACYGENTEIGTFENRDLVPAFKDLKI